MMAHSNYVFGHLKAGRLGIFGHQVFRVMSQRTSFENVLFQNFLIASRSTDLATADVYCCSTFSVEKNCTRNVGIIYLLHFERLVVGTTIRIVNSECPSLLTRPLSLRKVEWVSSSVRCSFRVKDA